LRIYFDRTQSPYVARAAGEILTFLGHTFEHARRKYERDPGDIVWMGDLARDGDWIVVTADDSIRRNPAERQAWINMGQTPFFMQPTWMKVPCEEQAWRLLRWLPRLLSHASTERCGTGLSLPLRWQEGRLRRLYSPHLKPG